MKKALKGKRWLPKLALGNNKEARQPQQKNYKIESNEQITYKIEGPCGVQIALNDVI